mgnify:CR=1
MYNILTSKPNPQVHFFAFPPPRRPNFPSPVFAFDATGGGGTTASFVTVGGPGRRIRSLKALESIPGSWLLSVNMNPSSNSLPLLCALRDFSCTLRNLSSNSPHLIPSSRPFRRLGLSYVDWAVVVGALFLVALEPYISLGRGESKGVRSCSLFKGEVWRVELTLGVRYASIQ